MKLKIFKKFDEAFLKYFKNFSWLLLERIFRVLSSAFIGILVINYLGPTKNGIISYSFVYFSIATTIANLGINSYVVKELIEKANSSNKILTTVLFLRVLSSIIVFLLFLVAIIIIDGINQTFYISIILLIPIFFQPLLFSESFFQSKLKLKFISICQILALLVSTILKLYGVLTLKGIMFFAISTSIEFIFYPILLFSIYKIQKNFIKIKNIDWTLFVAYLKKSIPLVLTNIFIIIYLKIDIFMLKNLNSEYETGIYSAATKISEMFYFIPIIIATTFFPAVVYAKNNSKKEYQVKSQKLYDLLTWIALPVIFFIYIFSNYVVQLLFTNEYSSVAQILKIHIIAVAFVFWGTISSNFFLVENRFWITVEKSVGGAVINIILNYFLIPDYGSIGAAIATLVSYFFSDVLFLLFYKIGKEQLYFILNSFNIVRIIISLKNKYLV